MRRAALLLAVALVVLGASPAFGHVSVTPKQAAKGATAMLSFSVPNEERLHATVEVEIVWPDDVSFTQVTPEPKEGWTFTPSPRSAKWSGGAIRGDLKEAFVVTLGPLPNTETIVFKALQTYDNGEVVRWIGAEATDNPAPVLTLTGQPLATVATTVVTAPTTTAVAPEEDEDDEGAGTNVTPIILGALVFAGIGIGIAIGARRRAAPRP